MKKNQHKYWQLCPTCYQLILTSASSLGNHRCPEIMIVKREVELDAVIEEEVYNWDELVDEFWEDPQVKFQQYLIEEEDGRSE